MSAELPDGLFRAVRREPEPARAAYPDEEGFAERDGVRVFWERYGEGEPAILLMAPWAFVHSRVWRAQIPYFARHHRVVVFDPRGNGRSDRPDDPAAYSEAEYARDAVAVMDASGTDRAVLVCVSRGAQRTLIAAAEHPERVQGAVFVGPEVHVDPRKAEHWLKGKLDQYDGWDRLNPEYIRADYPAFAEWWVRLVLPEPHSTRQIESGIQYALDTDAETLITATLGAQVQEDEVEGLAERVRCPVLVVMGELEQVVRFEPARRLAELTGGEFAVVPRAGHLPNARYPVQVNLMLREWISRVCAPAAAAGAASE